jgi:hypothetical protein
MGIACAGAADENGVALGVQEGAGGEFANRPLINGCVGEGERIQANVRTLFAAPVLYTFSKTIEASKLLTIQEAKDRLSQQIAQLSDHEVQSIVVKIRR